MAVSSLATEYYPAYEGNYTNGRDGRVIEKVCIHHCAGRLTAQQCGAIFQTPGRQTSAHYGIGYNGEIANYVDENNTAWANGNWDSNCKSVSIENSDEDSSWYVNDTTLNSLIRLVADIAKRNGLGTLVVGQNLICHSMVVNTACPGDYLRSKLQYIADEANKINDGGQPTPTPTIGVVADLQRWLNSNYGYNVDVDNIYGPDTKKHSIMALQTEFNRQLGSGLAVDGIFGPATYRACPNLYVGMSGNITRLVQYMLEVKGYSVGSYGIDGIYGNGTANAVRQFQANNGLAVDGICGSNTFSKLFN